MSLEFSPVISARRKVFSGGYSYYNLSERFFGGLIDPVLNLDHFTMSEASSQPTPRAGLSAVTYILEDSPSGLLNRDSLADPIGTRPGELHWTLAGQGVMHEERPLREGIEVRGIQLWVNLSPAGKKLPPQSFHITREKIPEWKPSPVVRGRVLAGKQGGVESPLKLPEPFTWIELFVKQRASYAGRVAAEHGALIYLLSGRIRVSGGDTIQNLDALQAIGVLAQEKQGEVMIEALEDSHFFFMSGKALREPIVTHGAFAMNTQAEIAAAIERFKAGKMGKLDPV